MRERYRIARRIGFIQFVLSILVSIPAVISIIVSDDTLNYFLAIASFALIVLWFAVNSLYHHNTSLSKTARRAAMVSNGFGGTFSNLLDQRLSGLFVNSELSSPKRDYSDYYDSTKPSGDHRLIEIVEESAFYSESSHRISWAILLFVVIIFVVVFLAIVFFAIPFYGNDDLMIVIRVFLAASVFFLSSDTLGRAILHRQAAQSCKSLYEICGGLTERVSHEDAVYLLVEYNCVMEAAPEIMPFAYTKKHEDRIDDKWRLRVRNRG